MEKVEYENNIIAEMVKKGYVITPASSNKVFTHTSVPVNYPSAFLGLYITSNGKDPLSASKISTDLIAIYKMFNYKIHSHFTSSVAIESTYFSGNFELLPDAGPLQEA